MIWATSRHPFVALLLRDRKMKSGRSKLGDFAHIKVSLFFDTSDTVRFLIRITLNHFAAVLQIFSILIACGLLVFVVV
jgi:hypothetical protein